MPKDVDKPPSESQRQTPEALPSNGGSKGALLALETMSWAHWLILLASLVLTIAAWRISSQQINEKAAARFDRNTSQIIDQVLERMQRYEDGLWAGVTFINTLGGEVDFETWRAFATNIGIERKYPGINGLGVIHYVPPGQLEHYLADQRRQRPDYNINPEHDKDEYWPISYIIPVNANQEAVGLDIAHEQNRYAAANLARGTGAATITGPIVLVQDELRTPGFLFFAPFYDRTPIPETLVERREAFRGLVYAPFVVRKLMDGVLARERRSISFSIHDRDEEIYNENLDHLESYDRRPLFESSVPIELYGRTWTFHFRSSLSFRQNVSNTQPATILAGGITVDLLLLALFLHISKSNAQAKSQARSLNQLSKKLEQANEELSQFNYRTSHDLVAPLRTIRGYVDLAIRDLKDQDFASVGALLERIDSQSSRLEELVRDLLNLCRIDRIDPQPSRIDVAELFDAVKASLDSYIQERGVTVTFRSSLKRPFYSQKIRIQQILENLVSNGIKYSDSRKAERWVEVRFSEAKGGRVRIEVEDNGIGIPADVKSKVYDMFYRVGNNREYGSGLGNYLVKKHVDHLGGSIDYHSGGDGTCFEVEVPNKA